LLRSWGLNYSDLNFISDNCATDAEIGNAYFPASASWDTGIHDAHEGIIEADFIEFVAFDGEVLIFVQELLQFVVADDGIAYDCELTHDCFSFFVVFYLSEYVCEFTYSLMYYFYK
jgi:hypothetical protein